MPSWLFACVQQGKGSWSSIATTQTAAAPPDSPSMPAVMGSNRTSVSIRWQPPEADGGSPVTSYEVELRPKTKAGLASMTDEWLTVYQVIFDSHCMVTCQASTLCPGTGHAVHVVDKRLDYRSQILCCCTLASQQCNATAHTGLLCLWILLSSQEKRLTTTLCVLRGRQQRAQWAACMLAVYIESAYGLRMLQAGASIAFQVM